MSKEKHLKERLKEITEILLNKDEDYLELKNAAEELFEFFSEAAGIKEEELHKKDYFTSNGKAIGTWWAGKCIQEFMRTRKFIRGIYKGIKKVKKTFEDEPIHILYAGTGPFGTLLIPLTSFFSSDEMKITFLEINKESIKSLSRIIDALGLRDYVIDIIECDAAKYQGDTGKPIHILVTETMQSALKKEPQVAITKHLAPQLVAGGVLIPENITVTANLVDSKKDYERLLGNNVSQSDICVTLGTVIEFNKNNCNDERIYSNIKMDIPSNLEKRFQGLFLFTEIQVFEDEVLGLRESSLNLPVKILDRSVAEHEVQSLIFRYVMDENPRFEYETLLGIKKPLPV